MSPGESIEMSEEYLPPNQRMKKQMSIGGIWKEAEKE